MLVEQVAEQAVAERDLDRLRAAPSEPGIEPGLGERLLEDREVGAGGSAGARTRNTPPDQVCAPPTSHGLGALELSLAGDQTREDLTEQPVISALTLLAGDRRVEDLRTPDGRPTVDLARREPGLLEPSQMGTQGVRV
jgi:hypothetical protein